MSLSYPSVLLPPLLLPFLLQLAWPQALRDLYRILSAFNLNIEIIALDCVVPDISYVQKFTGIVAFPFCIYAVFLVFAFFNMLWRRYVMRQRSWQTIKEQVAAGSSVIFILLQLTYLYVTKTLLDLWNCSPLNPSDGNTYMSQVFEPCGKPGGTQQMLTPLAVFGLIFYTLGYPGGVGTVFFLKRELIMEDQLLRARGMGRDKLTGPNTYMLRGALGRTYFQFKPDYFFWLLPLLAKKFSIAFSSLVFNRNSGFQMAAVTLVLFLAYAAQVRWQPYMSPSEFDTVIEEHLRLSEESPLHNRLRARLASVEAKQRKKGNKNSIAAGGSFSWQDTGSLLWTFLSDYNTVEAALLFSAVLVALCGVMLQTLKTTDSFYQAGRDGITAAVLTTVSASIIYYLVVFIGTIWKEWKAKVTLHKPAGASAGAAGKKGGLGSPGGKDDGTGTQRQLQRRGSLNGNSAGATGLKLSDRTNVFGQQAEDGGQEQLSMNPLFMNAKGEADVQQAQVDEAILSSDLPNEQLWQIFRKNYGQLTTQVKDLASTLSDVRKQMQRMEMEHSLGGAGVDGNGLEMSPMGSAAGSKKKTGTKHNFGPTAAVGSSKVLGSARTQGGPATAGGADGLRYAMQTSNRNLFKPPTAPLPAPEQRRADSVVFVRDEATGELVEVRGRQKLDLSSLEMGPQMEAAGASVSGSSSSRKGIHLDDDSGPSSPGFAAAQSSIRTVDTQASSTFESLRKPAKVAMGRFGGDEPKPASIFAAAAGGSGSRRSSVTGAAMSATAPPAAAIPPPPSDASAAPSRRESTLPATVSFPPPPSSTPSIKLPGPPPSN